MDYSKASAKTSTQEQVDAAVFGNAHKSDSIKSAVDDYISILQQDVYKGANSDDGFAIQGWVDATPSNAGTHGTSFYGDGVITTDTIGIKLSGHSTQYGSSNARNTYNSLLESADKRYGWQQVMVIGLIVNHVASAADAYITANRYNRELMNEKTDVLSRISVDNQLYFSETGSLTTGVSLAWHF